MLKPKANNSAEISRELYLFTVVSMLGGAVYGLYYGIFLYRNSLDLKVLVIDSLLVALSGWIGYMVGTFWIHRSGYLKAMRLSFILLFLTSVLTLLLIDSIRTIYPLLSVMRGLPGGIYASIIDVFLLKELSSLKRGRYLNLNLSMEFTIAIIIPVLIGLIIKFSGYRAVFLLAGLVYLAALFLPINYNKRPHSRVGLEDELHLMKLPGIKEFNFNTALTNGADQLNILLIAIVPFLIFRDELKVGSFTSVVAIVAAAVSFWFRNRRYDTQIRWGYFGNFGRLLSNFGLSIFWNPVALVFQGMINKSMSPLNDPVFRRLRVDNATKILGDELSSEALQMDMINATMAFIGECGALAIFLVILSFDSGHQILALRALLVVYGLWKIANYFWVLDMRRRLSRAHVAEVVV